MQHCAFVVTAERFREVKAPQSNIRATRDTPLTPVPPMDTQVLRNTPVHRAMDRSRWFILADRSIVAR